MDDWGYDPRTGDNEAQPPRNPARPVDDWGVPVDNRGALTSANVEFSTIPRPYYDSYLIQLLEPRPVHGSSRRLGP